MFIILIIRICNIECNVIKKVLVMCEKYDEKYRCKRIVVKLFLDSFIHMRFLNFYFILRGIFIKKFQIILYNKMSKFVSERRVSPSSLI